MVFAWSAYSPFRIIEHMGSALLDALAAEEAKTKGPPKKGSPAARYGRSADDKAVQNRARAIAGNNANDVVREMAKQLPLFTTAVGDASSKRVHVVDHNTTADAKAEEEEAFSYSQFMLRHRRGDFAPSAVSSRTLYSPAACGRLPSGIRPSPSTPKTLP